MLARRWIIVLILLCLWMLPISVHAQSSTSYTTPGTYDYIVPSGATSLIVEGWAGGGGGGAGGSAASPLAICAGGGGGAGGAYVKVQFDVTPGETVEVVVGGGGAGGARGESPTFVGENGGKGGNSSVFYDGYNPFVAGGGNGGLRASCSTIGIGGGPGTFSVGFPAIELDSQLGSAGQNGSSGGAGGNGGDSYQGLADGGKGGNSKGAGAKGEDGRVIITPIFATAPTANDDNFAVDEGTSNLLDVMGNDGGTDIGISAVSDPPNGTASIEGDQIRYQPNANYFGSDSFTYTIANIVGSDTATVTITVNPLNDPPVAQDDSASATAGIPKTIDVLENDFDIDGPSLSIIGVGAAGKGTTAIVANQIVYTPNDDASASDSFTYTISDGLLSDSAIVTVNITSAANNAPDAQNDAVSVNEGASITFDPRENDSDADDDPLTVTGVSIPSHGTASFTATSITYTPNSNYFGSDVFTYSISDGNGGVDTATVNITVNAVNDPPVAQDDSASTDENTPIVILALENDFDIDGPSLSVISVGTAGHGSVSFTVSTITYTPNSGYTGPDSFTYTISDGLLNDSATVSVTVNDVNNPPSADNDVYVVVTGNTLNGNVLSDDSDPDGDPLTASLVTGPAHASSFVLNADGSFSYTPESGYTGDDSFTYAAYDGEFSSNVATAFITVNATDPSENRPPIAQNDSYTTAFNTTVNGNVLGNDSDPDGDPLIASLTSGPSHGALTLNADGSFSYTPDDGFVGDDSFSYAASDGALAAGATAFIAVAGPPPTCEPNPKGDLSYEWSIGGASATATVTNNSALCVYQVGFAVYQRPNEPIDNQILYDYDGDTVNGGAVQLGPNETATLTVDLPNCAAQLDLFYGRVLPSLNGQRYGERLLKGAFLNGANWCVVEEPQGD